VALERQNPAIIDDHHVEALSLSAYINFAFGLHQRRLNSHASKHAPPQRRPHAG
jgi:hypothetical protein